MAISAHWLGGYDIGAGTAGTSAVVDPDTFHSALRDLAAAPYRAAAAASEAEWVVDTVPDDEVNSIVVERLFPDVPLVDSADDAFPAGVVPVLSADDTEPDAAVERGLVVVLGAGRSGTTWLHRLLTAHPKAAGIDTGETWIFASAGQFWRAHQERAGIETWIDEEHLLAAIRACCDRVIASGMTRLRPGATHFVEKTPAHVWHLPLIARMYPNAAFVHLIRDGRDVALSLTRAEGTPQEPGAAATHWANAVRTVRAAAPGLNRYTEVRYESLLADPVGVASALLGWIGLEPDAEFEQVARERSSERVSPLAMVGRVGAGKWRDTDRSFKRAVNAAAGDLLDELGYV
jgi:LPS sulfotransferase NodH